MLGRKDKQPTGRQRPDLHGQNPNVFSYYSNRARTEEQTRSYDEAVRQRKPRGWWLRNLPTFIAMIVFGVCFIYLMGIDANPKVIQTSAVSSASLYRDLDTYRFGAEEIIGKSIWNRNKLTIDRGAIVRELKNRFPELAGVEIIVPIMGRRPVIRVVPTEPSLLMMSKETVYVLDARGMALMSVNEAVRLAKNDLPVVLDESGLAIESGKVALPAGDVKFIRQMLEYLKDKELAVQALTLPAQAGELHLRINGLPYYIKFNMLSDARQQSGTFFAVKEKLETEGRKPAEYIDVRVEEKAFYR